MFAHGIMTALLFSSIGYIYDRTHTKLIPELGGLSRIMPVASAFFIIAALAGMGVPGLANFWGELLVFMAALKAYPVLGIIAVVALVVTALFMLRVLQQTFYGPENERFAKLPDISLSAWNSPDNTCCGPVDPWILPFFSFRHDPDCIGSLHEWIAKMNWIICRPGNILFCRRPVVSAALFCRRARPETGVT